MCSTHACFNSALCHAFSWPHSHWLQMALLDQLAAHAGIGVTLAGQQAQGGMVREEAEGEEGEGEEGQQPGAAAEAQGSRPGGYQIAREQHSGQQLEVAREEGSAGQQGDEGERQATASVWDRSGGSWWVAIEEARAGEITQVGKEGRAIGEAMRAKSPTIALKDFHLDIIWMCFCDWGTADGGLAALMRASWPPPLLRAQLACRAAEALCRLYRGQGLGGAYGPAPCFEGNDAEVSELLHLYHPADAVW